MAVREKVNLMRVVKFGCRCIEDSGESEELKVLLMS